MRRNGHPSRPKAITCCFFASLKTLLISTKATALRRNQRPRASFSLAGFQVTLIGRFWVTPEATGLLRRYPVTASEFHLIGKETERGQAEDISTLLPSLKRYELRAQTVTIEDGVTAVQAFRQQRSSSFTWETTRRRKTSRDRSR